MVLAAKASRGLRGAGGIARHHAPGGARSIRSGAAAARRRFGGRIPESAAVEQSTLADPQAGDLVPGTGGLRKIRLGQPKVGRGRRGGVRVYYLDLPRRGVTHLVAIFGKREKSDLSPAERRIVAALVGQLKKNPKVLL